MSQRGESGSGNFAYDLAEREEIYLELAELLFTKVTSSRELDKKKRRLMQ